MKRTAVALPRIGLIGNPSDGYGGKVIAFTFTDFHARVELEEAPRLVVTSPSGREATAPDLESLLAKLHEEPPPTDGSELLLAACKRFLDHCRAEGLGPATLPASSSRLRFQMRFASDIPRQVGFAGSSAICTAALRVLADHFHVSLDADTMARLALAAETEELGITAGPQDRVIQAHEGLMFMDFGPVPTNRRLAIELLPPLFIAWSSAPGSPSGNAHGEIRRRFDAGDVEIQAAIARFPILADQALECLEDGDFRILRRLIDRNFDTRASIWPLGAADRELVELGRKHRAAVKLAGSGGGVVGVLEEEGDWPEIREAYREAGFQAMRPRIGGGLPEMQDA